MGSPDSQEPWALIVTDVDGRIVLWNAGAERLYGWTRDEVVGRLVADVVVPTELSEAADEIMTSLADPSSAGWRGPFQVKRKDGSSVAVYVEDAPIVVDGHVVAIVGESAPVGGLRSLDAEMAAIAPGAGVRAVLDARRSWFDSFLTRAHTAMSVRELDDLLVEVLATAASSIGADAASLLVTDDGGETLVLRAAYGWDAERMQPIRIPAGAGVSGRILATHGPVIVDELDEVEIHSPELRASGFHSYIGVPLIERNRVVGVLLATSFEAARFSVADIDTLNLLAAPLGTAVHRVRQFVQLANAANPIDLPLVDGLELHARYVAADGGNGGGDWYDVVTRDDGTVAIVIGDAAGHGLNALVGAASVRHALVAYLHEGHSPAAALGRLQRLIAAASFGTRADFVTVGVCVYDPASGTLHTASAGHPPLLQVRGGTASFGEPPDPPISSALPPCAFSETASVLAPGDLVVLYTDGLIEARGDALDAGLERLSAAAVDHRNEPLDELSAAVVASRTATATNDDYSLLLLRVSG